MKSVAQKLELVIDLYSYGLLCKCTNVTEIPIEDEYGDLVKIETIIKHRKNCNGRKKAMKLLYIREENETFK